MPLISFFFVLVVAGGGRKGKLLYTVYSELEEFNKECVVYLITVSSPLPPDKLSLPSPPASIQTMSEMSLFFLIIIIIPHPSLDGSMKK